IHNLGIQLKPFGSYFAFSHFPLGYWLVAAVTLLAVLGLFACGNWTSAVPRRACLCGIGLAALGVLLGIGPFLPMRGVARTQFYAAPCEAALLALCLAFMCSWFGKRLGFLALACGVGLLAANSSVESHQGQDATPQPISFEKTVRIFEQIHALSPSFD